MSTLNDRNLEMARRVAVAVDAAGGRTYFVGGFVRDRLLGRENKDIDIEVHGVSVGTLEGILDQLGQRTAMGASFGVMGLRHCELDIAMPRSEAATGRGHRDFEVYVDPFIGAKKAAMRRDFTMNALMQDVLTGEILDFFGGRADMAARRIRHVSDLTFAEDPLRVFRAAQFSARFDFDVAADTVALCATMDVEALARERVMGELEKALLKAAHPSVFFEQLRRMDQLAVWFQALQALEASAWRDVMSALDGAAALRASAQRPLEFMMASLCLHLSDDVAARALLERVTNEVQLIRYALNQFGLYRRLCELLASNAGTNDWMALYDASVCPEDLLLLARAAAEGRGEADAWEREDQRLRERLGLYRRRMEVPCVTGKDLVAAGMKPGPRMGRALAYAHELRLAGVPKAQQLALTLRFIREGEA